MSTTRSQWGIGRSAVISWFGVLRRPLHFDRRGMSLGLAPVPDAATTSQGRRPIGRAGRDLQPEALRLMTIALKYLLDRYPPSRQGLRALAFVERGLHACGAFMFEDLEVSALNVARNQLERLVVDWSDRGLADLRSRLAIAVAERDAATPTLRDAPVMSNFWVESRLSVDDASLSVFDEVQRRWAASPQMPLKR